jgi:hypothetical protein
LPSDIERTNPDTGPELELEIEAQHMRSLVGTVEEVVIERAEV